MFLKTTHRLAIIGMMGLMVSGCVNNGQKMPVSMKSVMTGAVVGAGIGAAVGSASGNVATGAIVGGVAGSVVGLFHHSKKQLLHELAKMDIQYIEYGDTHVLIVPTDRYFEINTHRMNDQCYSGLMNIIRLLRYYPCSVFYVAGFTDDIGTHTEKEKLSQSRADAIMTFLWAHDIHAQQLRAEGYGDKFDVGDNHLTHGSSYNRRVEIQWVNVGACAMTPMLDAVDSK